MPFLYPFFLPTIQKATSSAFSIPQTFSFSFYSCHYFTSCFLASLSLLVDMNSLCVLRLCPLQYIESPGSFSNSITLKSNLIECGPRDQTADMRQYYITDNKTNLIECGTRDQTADRRQYYITSLKSNNLTS